MKFDGLSHVFDSVAAPLSRKEPALIFELMDDFANFHKFSKLASASTFKAEHAIIRLPPLVDDLLVVAGVNVNTGDAFGNVHHVIFGIVVKR
jgi:hypothetical protein